MPLTVRIVAAVEFQHTFADDDLEHSGLVDIEPTDAAMQALVIRIENLLRPGILPRRVELEVDPDSAAEDDATPDLNWRPS
jgi:hypothetical protein